MPRIVTTSSPNKTPKASALTIVLAIALLAALAYILFGRTPATPLAEEHTAKATPVEAVASETKTGSAAQQSGNAKIEETARISSESLDGNRATYNGVDAPIPQAPLVTADEPKVLSQEEMLEGHLVFNNEVENTIEKISIPGATFIEIPQINLSQEEILEYLRKPVEIFDDDDNEMVAAKERTAEFKTAALKYVEEGGTLNQFIRDVCAEESEKNATIKDIQNEKKRLLETEGEEAAQKYLDQVNPQLKAAGLKEVKISFTDRRMLQRKQAKEEAARNK